MHTALSSRLSVPTGQRSAEPAVTPGNHLAVLSSEVVRFDADLLFVRPGVIPLRAELKGCCDVAD